ncbi:hypothetical protein SDJN03_17969, partial [Cucurbita argyrosperma subsp. sororia]
MVQDLSVNAVIALGDPKHALNIEQYEIGRELRTKLTEFRNPSFNVFQSGLFIWFLALLLQLSPCLGRVSILIDFQECYT